MSTIEYLAFLPLLIYGLAISDIVNHWRRYLYKEDFYLPYVMSAFMVLEGAIFSVFEYLQLLDELVDNDYAHYLALLVPPLIFLALAKVLTPDRDRNTKEYFMANVRVIFTLSAIFSASHWLYDFKPENIYLTVIRIITITFLIAIATTKKIRLIYFFFVFYVITLIYNLSL